MGRICPDPNARCPPPLPPLHLRGAIVPGRVTTFSTSPALCLPASSLFAPPGFCVCMNFSVSKTYFYQKYFCVYQKYFCLYQNLFLYSPEIFLGSPVFLAMCSTFSSALLAIYGVCHLLCHHLQIRFEDMLIRMVRTMMGMVIMAGMLMMMMMIRMMIYGGNLSGDKIPP